MSEKQLGIYTDGNDYVVAYGVEDAMKVWGEIVGDDYVADLYGDEGDWGLDDSDKIHRIYQEDEPSPEDVPIGGTTGKQEHWFIEATGHQWIEHSGRGWLCSHEW